MSRNHLRSFFLLFIASAVLYWLREHEEPDAG